MEGAAHIHFDPGPLCQANIIANLASTLERRGARLRLLCATPAHLPRAVGWPPTLAACVNSADFRALDWPAALARLRALGLSTYNDFNLENIAYERTDRHTFEVRIFAASAESTPGVAAAALIEGVLRHCHRATSIDRAPTSPWDREEMADLPLDRAAGAYWRERATQVRQSTHLDGATIDAIQAARGSDTPMRVSPRKGVFPDRLPHTFHHSGSTAVRLFRTSAVAYDYRAALLRILHLHTMS